MSHAENLSYRLGGHVHGRVGDDESVSGRPVGQAGQSSGPAPELPSELAARKAELRLRVLGARRRLSPAERALAGRQLRDAILEDPQTQMAGVVAAYVSVGSEPDTRALIFALWKRGTYVLLPLLRPDQDLDWASYEGPDSLIEGARGLVEPSETPRGVEAITSADLVLVPALAADRVGNRLGRGGGSYDRALARVGPAVPTIALLYEDELMDDIPAGPHDQRIRAVAQPAEGIIRLA
jgi:5-formyltetrahydrofolate cyclo-ligase